MEDNGFIALGKYSSARDSILHYLCLAGWANESFGNVESPTGYVWRITNDPADVSQDNTEFQSVLDTWLTDSPEVTDSPALRDELVGNFLVTEDSNGFIGVTRYLSEHLLIQAFDSLASIYSEWDSQDDE
jgi:hypothetical protein